MLNNSKYSAILNYDLDIGTTDSFGGGGGSGGGGGFGKKNGKRKSNGTKPKLLMSSLKQGRRALAARTKAPINIHSSIPSQGDNFIKIIFVLQLFSADCRNNYTL